MDICYKDICDKVVEIAINAGGFIREQRKSFSLDRVEVKGYQDMVSYVDKQAEEMIVKMLKPLIKDARFITEEGTETYDSTSENEYCWIIDPLDGTTNFVHGLPPYCVSIALSKADEIVVGVIYEVTLSECFYSFKGGMSYLNSDVIRSSEVLFLKDSLIATGMAYNSLDRLDEFHSQMDYFMRYTHGARRIGSAAADLAYVAAGRFEAFSQFNLSPWDVAAGIIIAKNAGAVVSDYSGGNNMLFGKEIVVAGVNIYKEYIDLINKYKSQNLND